MYSLMMPEDGDGGGNHLPENEEDLIAQAHKKSLEWLEVRRKRERGRREIGKKIAS